MVPRVPLDASVLVMEYVCLAAGHGSRFGELGRYLQKCMYPVGLRPFLEHTLLQWLEGVAANPRRDRLTLVVGHFEEQLRGYFGDAFEGVPLRYVAQGALRGTGHAVGVGVDDMRAHGDAAVVVWLADLFVPADAFRALLAHPAAAVAAQALGDADESPRLRATRVGERVTCVWDGSGPWLDAGLWRLPLPVARDLRRVRAEKGEYRVLPNLQRHVDEGLELGWITLSEWLHLGGVHPTPEANVRHVVRRLWERRP